MHQGAQQQRLQEQQEWLRNCAVGLDNPHASLLPLINVMNRSKLLVAHKRRAAKENSAKGKEKVNKKGR